MTTSTSTSTGPVAHSAASTQPPVLAERRGVLGRILLNRPKAINALTHEMVHLVRAALDEWAADPAIEVVAITGAGDRGLCAGGDIVSIHRDATTGGTGSEDFWRDEYRLNSRLATYPKPVVALMDGIVLGGGVGVSAHCSHRLVTERTSVGMPETGIGFLPDVGGTWLLSHAPGELGTYLALTAGHASAGDAIHLGLADLYLESSQMGDLLHALEQGQVDTVLGDLAEPAPASELETHREWIDAAFAHDDVEEILAALRARPEDVAAKAHARIVRNSPTALVVTLRALRVARAMPGLDKALAQEYRIALRMLRGHDFPEGIRAQVIDKDRTPRWEPAQLANVDPAVVDLHFSDLGPHELDLSPNALSHDRKDRTS
jgi:enoyl-CoA hydratase